LAALLHGTLVVGVSQTLRRWTEGATYIRQGGHHVGHWPTFLVELRFHVPLGSKMGHLGDVLPNQSLGLVLTKQNLTQKANNTRKSSLRWKTQMLRLNKWTKTKPKPKPTLISKNCSYVCANRCTKLSYTTQHQTVLIIFPLVLQTISIAQMMSTGRKGVSCNDISTLI